MAIIDTLFITKTAETPYPLGPHILVYTVAHIREYPPPPAPDLSPRSVTEITIFIMCLKNFSFAIFFDNFLFKLHYIEVN